MTDPLAELITLLRPARVMGKRISGAGRWGVRYAPFGHPGFCVVTDGACLLTVDGADPLHLQAGDFVFLPATPGFILSGFVPVEPQLVDPAALAAQDLELRHGALEGEPDVRMLGGYFVFESPDTALLVTLLPPVIHVRGEDRLGVLVRLVREEAMQTRAGRDLILTRLVEVLLIEALRAAPGAGAPAGLLRGLADERLARSIREMHREPARAWTVEQLAQVAALSRSAYFQRFTRAVGMPPMEYLIAWRMAIAKDMLDRQELGMEQVAERVGYSSASTFSTAFARHVGRPPSGYARERRRLRSPVA
ncbi:cupin domain-containing protein [Pseudoxanthomonas sp. UC19_8]|uniref:AraC family transcriptional regulator n=1 Tax=Pseudoxanthomonas sp. UC19_8 TaxID=3350175 RepID=UPI0036D39464